MLSIVDRYLLVEALKTFLAIVSTLMLVVASMLFLRTLEEINVGALNPGLILHFLGLQLVRDSSSILPPAFFLAALGALNRLARDSELIALNACGIGPGRVYLALLFLAVPVALVTGWLALVYQPWAAGEIAEVRLQQKEEAAQIEGLQAGRFYLEQTGKLVVYIGSIDREKGLGNVFVLDRREGPERLVVSNRGHHSVEEPSGDHLVALIDGHRFDGTPGKGRYMVGRFREYQIRIRSNGNQAPANIKRTTEPSLALLASADLGDRSELQHRISAPLAVLVFTTIAVPLVAISPRQRTSGKMITAFLAYFSFFNLQRLAESWLANGVTPPWLTGLWYQALILVLVYLALIPESLWLQRLRRRWRGEPGAAPVPSGNREAAS